MRYTHKRKQPNGRSKLTTLASVLSAFVMVTCGDSTEEPVHVDPVGQVPQPMVENVGPSMIAAGQEITVSGTGFVDPSYGHTRITMDGTYSAGGPAHLEAVARYESPGVVSFIFGPNIPFSPDNQLGTFQGTLTATNVGNNGATVASSAVNVQLTVGPSLILRQFRPAGAGCDPGLTATTAEEKFLVEVEAVGLNPGSPEAPLRFTYGFLRENFQMRGYLDGQLAMNPESLFPPRGSVLVMDLVTQGTVSTLGNGVPRQVYVSPGSSSSNPGTVLPSGVDNIFGLTDIYTAPVTGDGGVMAGDRGSSYDATMTIAAVDSAGNQTQRTVLLRVWKPLEVFYDGNEEVVRTFDPVAVSGCISGADVGVTVSYSESKSETRNRSFMVRGQGGGNLNFDFWILKGQVSTEMGFQVENSVSSAEATNWGSSVLIVPGQFGVWFRQTTQLEKRAQLIEHGPCGHKQLLGEAIVTDWVWSADMAKTNSGRCPPLPEPRLAPGQIFKPEAF